MTTQTVHRVEKRLLRMHEAARMLGLCRASVYNLIARGDLPLVKLGRASRIPSDAVDQLIRRRTISHE